MYHHCLSALWGPFYSVFLSLSSRRRRRPISFIQLIPDGEDWDNENEETTSLFFVLCLFSAAALGQRERERKTRKLRNCARKSFFFTPRLFLHACYFSWPVCCLPETGIPHRKNIFFLKMHIKLLRVCQEERSTVALFPLSGKATAAIFSFRPISLPFVVLRTNARLKGRRRRQEANTCNCPSGTYIQSEEARARRREGGGLQDHHHLT